MPPDFNQIHNENLDDTLITQGILLDRRGIENESFAFCKDCHSHICKGKTPPLSLANHLLLGDIPPELQDLTPVEESMIARCRAKACIIQMRGDDGITLPNTQRGIQGHVVIYPQKPDNLLNVLPPSFADVCTPICVVFIGSQRPTQEWLRRNARPLIVRRERVRAALLWLKTHNSLYNEIIIDENSLAHFPENDALSVHIEVVPTPESAEILTSTYDSVHDPSNDIASNVNSTEPVFDSVVVTGLSTDASSNAMRTAAMLHMKSKGGGFVQIPHGDKPVNEFYNPELLPLTYPTLFPYGQGGFEDLQRTTPLSFKRQVKHFFSLADCRFQQHYSFLFTVFNILQRRAILLQTSLKVKHSSFDSFSRKFSNISSEAIYKVCQLLSCGNKNSLAQCTTAEERRVMRLMNEVNIINSHVPGSSAARVTSPPKGDSFFYSRGS